MKRWPLILLALAATTHAQPDAGDRQQQLESRREFLLARLAEIDAELSGEAPEGSVRLFGDNWQRPDRPDLAGDRREPDRGERRPPMTERERARLLAGLREQAPELAAHLNAMASHDGARHRRGSDRLLGRIRELAELREKDPESYEVRLRDLRAGLDVLKRSAELRELLASDPSDEAREAALTQLRSAVEEGFDAKAAMLGLEIRRNQLRTEQMQARSDHADANRDEIINEHFDKLVRRIESAAEHRDRPPR